MVGEMGGGREKDTSPLPKICHTFTEIVKLLTVISYVKKIQKTHESRDTLSEFC